MLVVVLHSDSDDNHPKAHAKKYRIAYIEANDFWAFAEIMNAIKENLARMGWKDRIEFPEDARIHTGWGAPGSEKMLNDEATKLMSRNDIDLIITAGTPPTAAVLKVNNGRTPVLAIAVSDPVRSGFVSQSPRIQALITSRPALFRIASNRCLPFFIKWFDSKSWVCCQ